MINVVCAENFLIPQKRIILLMQIFRNKCMRDIQVVDSTVSACVSNCTSSIKIFKTLHFLLYNAILYSFWNHTRSFCVLFYLSPFFLEINKPLWCIITWISMKSSFWEYTYFANNGMIKKTYFFLYKRLLWDD